mgnify:CR=1 FL=1
MAVMHSRTLKRKKTRLLMQLFFFYDKSWRHLRRPFCTSQMCLIWIVTETTYFVAHRKGFPFWLTCFKYIFCDERIIRWVADPGRGILVHFDHFTSHLWDLFFPSVHRCGGWGGRHPPPPRLHTSLWPKRCNLGHFDFFKFNFPLFLSSFLIFPPAL